MAALEYEIKNVLYFNSINIIENNIIMTANSVRYVFFFKNVVL